MKRQKYQEYRNYDEAPNWFVTLFAVLYVLCFAFAIFLVGNECKTSFERLNNQLTQVVK